jgi:intracellular multiplication protein IcmO
MADKYLRGLRKEQEVDPRKLHRPVVPIAVQAGRAAVHPKVVGGVLWGAAVCMWAAPSWAFVIFAVFVTYGFLILSTGLKARLQFRVPMSYGGLDYNNKNAAGKVQKAEGIAYLGNCLDTGEELSVSNSDLRTHTVVFGTTGSGKTELLLSMVSNALTWASGFLFSDGKADTSLMGKIYSLARRFGREDDVLALNYMTGSSDAGGQSNSMNPFASGSAPELAEIMVSLLGDSGASGDMWKQRAISLGQTVMPLLTFLRDQGKLKLNVSILRKAMELDRLISLWAGRPIHEGEPGSAWEIHLENYTLPPNVKEALSGYLNSLPGFNVQKALEGKNQDNKCYEQHGFLQMQFTKALSDFADQYGHIFATPYGDIDLEDVVLQRRILVIMLPSLEKSPDNVSALGKIVVASMQSMMAKALGAKIEGAWEDIIDTKPTNSETPFLAVLDEVGYYTTEGMAVMAAQARSLGFGLIFAAQDISAMKKNGGAVEKAVDAIIANCNLKVFGKLEDPKDTAELFKQIVGEAAVLETGGWQVNQNSTVMSYQDQGSVSVQRRNRGDMLDLKAQIAGEWHFIFGTTIIRGRGFYAAPKTVKYLRMNKFLRIRDVDASVLSRGEETREAARLALRLSSGVLVQDTVVPEEVDPTLQVMALSVDYFERRRQSKRDEPGTAPALTFIAMADHLLGGLNPDGIDHEFRVRIAGQAMDTPPATAGASTAGADSEAPNDTAPDGTAPDDTASDGTASDGTDIPKVTAQDAAQGDEQSGEAPGSREDRSVVPADGAEVPLGTARHDEMTGEATTEETLLAVGDDASEEIVGVQQRGGVGQVLHARHDDDVDMPDAVVDGEEGVDEAGGGFLPAEGSSSRLFKGTQQDGAVPEASDSEDDLDLDDEDGADGSGDGGSSVLSDGAAGAERVFDKITSSVLEQNLDAASAQSGSERRAARSLQGADGIRACDAAIAQSLANAQDRRDEGAAGGQRGSVGRIDEASASDYTFRVSDAIQRRLKADKPEGATESRRSDARTEALAMAARLEARVVARASGSSEDDEASAFERVTNDAVRFLAPVVEVVDTPAEGPASSAGDLAPALEVNQAGLDQGAAGQGRAPSDGGDRLDDNDAAEKAAQRRAINRAAQGVMMMRGPRNREPRRAPTIRRDLVMYATQKTTRALQDVSTTKGDEKGENDGRDGE